MSAGDTILVEAILFAQDKHAGQRRKGGGSYLEHPLRVMRTLRDLGAAYPVVFAAVLHDVLEDTDTTPIELQCRFGLTVTNLVIAVTHDKRMRPGDRKREEVARVANMHTVPGALHIKLADMLDNLRDRVAAPTMFADNAGYLAWKVRCVAGARNHPTVVDDPILCSLLAQFDALIAEARQKNLLSDYELMPEALEAYFARCNRAG